MKKLDATNLKADWNVIEQRAPSDCITSAELAKVLGVHLQSINNWCIRNVMPRPEPHSPRLRGNKNYFRISKIMAWLGDVAEDEINRQWLKNTWGIDDDLSPSQVDYLMQQLSPR